MFNNIKIADDHKKIIKMLAKDSTYSEDEILYLFIEMGIAFIIAWRKGKDDEAIVAMKEKLEKEPNINRISQRLELFFDKGQ